MVEPVIGLDGLDVVRYSSARELPYRLDDDSAHFLGSFGVVTKRYDAQGECYAVKQLSISTKNRSRPSREDMQTIANEIRMLKLCDHPHLLRLIGAYTLDTIPATFFLVTQPWAPTTLDAFLESVDSNMMSHESWWNSRSSFQRCYHLFSGLLSGLSYLHQHQIMHKDIKPQNIVLDGPKPVIIDFGISKIYRPKAATNYTKSTFEYLAPEQISHTASTPSADVFALGCCFLLIYATAYGGSTSLQNVYDILQENYRSCQYARELEHLFPFLRTVTQPLPPIVFIVRDMLIHNWTNRPGCKHLSRALTRMVDPYSSEKIPCPMLSTRFLLLTQDLSSFAAANKFDDMNAALVEADMPPRFIEVAISTNLSKFGSNSRGEKNVKVCNVVLDTHPTCHPFSSKAQNAMGISLDPIKTPFICRV